MTTLKEKWEGTDLPTIKAKETESELSILAEDNVSEKRWRSKYLSPHTTNNSWDLTLDEVGHQGHTHIFNVGKVFTKAYCREIIEEAEANGEWTNKRHDVQNIPRSKTG